MPCVCGFSFAVEAKHNKIIEEMESVCEQSAEYINHLGGRRFCSEFGGKSQPMRSSGREL